LCQYPYSFISEKKLFILEITNTIVLKELELNMRTTFGGHLVNYFTARSRVSTLLPRLVISTALTLASALSAAAQGSLTIPSSLTGTQSESASLNTGEPSPGAFSTLVVTTAAGSFTAGTYNAWCLNSYGIVPNAPISYSAFSSEAVSSTNLSDLGITQAELNEIDWLINNTTGATGEVASTVNDVQQAIWTIVGTPESPTANSAQLVADAQANGASFVPGPSQLIGIVLTPGPTSSNQPILVVATVPSSTNTNPPNPAITLKKTANASTAKCFQQVTYSYTVTNTGNVPVTNITVVDDNGTPNYLGDDVTVGTIASLAPGKSVTLTANLYLPITETATDWWGNTQKCTLITKQKSNGNICVTLVQDPNSVDNTYGSNSAKNWGGSGNSFESMVESNGAEFQFFDTKGNLVLDFTADYLSPNSKCPSGYGTQGVQRNNPTSGDCSKIVNIETSLSDNLNQGPKYNKCTNNSPAWQDGNWNFQCGYTVEIDKHAFGGNGFGKCVTPTVQNGHCKNFSSGKSRPKPCSSSVTNTAKATGSAGTTVLTATAKATVSLTVSSSSNGDNHDNNNDDNDNDNWSNQGWW
jgi:hypothetical protein